MANQLENSVSCQDLCLNSIDNYKYFQCYYSVCVAPHVSPIIRCSSFYSTILPQKWKWFFLAVDILFGLHPENKGHFCSGIASNLYVDYLYFPNLGMYLERIPIHGFIVSIQLYLIISNLSANHWLLSQILFQHIVCFIQ